MRNDMFMLACMLLIGCSTEDQESTSLVEKPSPQESRGLYAHASGEAFVPAIAEMRPGDPYPKSHWAAGAPKNELPDLLDFPTGIKGDGALVPVWELSYHDVFNSDPDKRTHNLEAMMNILPPGIIDGSIAAENWRSGIPDFAGLTEGKSAHVAAFRLAKERWLRLVREYQQYPKYAQILEHYAHGVVPDPARVLPKGGGRVSVPGSVDRDAATPESPTAAAADNFGAFVAEVICITSLGTLITGDRLDRTPDGAEIVPATTSERVTAGASVAAEALGAAALRYGVSRLSPLVKKYLLRGDDAAQQLVRRAENLVDDEPVQLTMPYTQLDHVPERFRVPDPDKGGIPASGPALDTYLSERNAMQSFEALTGQTVTPATEMGTGDFLIRYADGSVSHYDVKTFIPDDVLLERIGQGRALGKAALKKFERERFTAENAIRFVLEQKERGRKTVFPISALAEDEVDRLVRQLLIQDLLDFVYLVP